MTTALQSSVAVSNAVSQVAPLLTVAQEGSVDMSTFGANLGDWATAMMAGDSTAQNAAAASAAAAVATQSANAGVSVSFNANTLTSPTNYLAILNDTIAINGTDFTLTQFHNGLSVVGASDASLDTIGFTFSVVGTPIPANADGVKTASISLGIELADTTTGQLAQIMINQVNITIDSQNKISINVPANATAYVYGKTASGATANLTLVNVGADTASVVNNLVTFNAGIVFDKIASAIEGDSAAEAVFGSLQHVKGTFNTKVVMSAVDLRNQDGTSAPGLSLSVIGSGQAPMSGLGEQGVITIQ